MGAIGLIICCFLFFLLLPLGLFLFTYIFRQSCVLSGLPKPSVIAAPVAEAGLEREAVFAPEPQSKDDLAATGEVRARTASPIVVDADRAREAKARAEEDAAAPSKLAARDEKRKDQARAVPAAAPPIAMEVMTQSTSVGGARQTALLDDLRRTLDSGSMPDPKAVRTDDVIRSLSTVSTGRGRGAVGLGRNHLMNLICGNLPNRVPHEKGIQRYRLLTSR